MWSCFTLVSILLFMKLPLKRAGSSGNCPDALLPIKECQFSSKSSQQCMHPNELYIIAGELCLNTGGNGHCDVANTLVGISFGSSHEFKNVNGIAYTPEYHFEKSGSNRAFIPEVVNPDLLPNKTKDKDLYTSGILPNPALCNQKIEPCVHYTLPLEGLAPGQYEVGIRFVKAPSSQRGYRVDRNTYPSSIKRQFERDLNNYFQIFVQRFNVFACGQLLLQDFDLLRHSNNSHNPIDVFVNMDVGIKQVLLGTQPYALFNPLHLGFCFGGCGEREGFIISAFHIVQHKVAPKEPCRKRANNVNGVPEWIMAKSNPSPRRGRKKQKSKGHRKKKK